MGRVVGLNEMVKESLIMKMAFGKDLKEVRESDTAVIWRKSLLSRWNSQCKIPEAGICLECPGKMREVPAAGAG